MIKEADLINLIEKGNKEFNAKQYKKAIEHYKSAYTILETADGKKVDFDVKFHKARLHNYIACCHLELHEEPKEGNYDLNLEIGIITRQSHLSQAHTHLNHPDFDKLQNNTLKSPAKTKLYEELGETRKQNINLVNIRLGNYLWNYACEFIKSGLNGVDDVALNFAYKGILCFEAAHKNFLQIEDAYVIADEYKRQSCINKTEEILLINYEAYADRLFDSAQKEQSVDEKIKKLKATVEFYAKCFDLNIITKKPDKIILLRLSILTVYFEIAKHENFSREYAEKMLGYIKDKKLEEIKDDVTHLIQIYDHQFNAYKLLDKYDEAYKIAGQIEDAYVDIGDNVHDLALTDMYSQAVLFRKEYQSKQVLAKTSRLSNKNASIGSQPLVGKLKVRIGDQSITTLNFKELSKRETKGNNREGLLKRKQDSSFEGENKKNKIEGNKFPSNEQPTNKSVSGQKHSNQTLTDSKKNFNSNITQVKTSPSIPRKNPAISKTLSKERIGMDTNAKSTPFWQFKEYDVAVMQEAQLIAEDFNKDIKQLLKTVYTPGFAANLLQQLALTSLDYCKDKINAMDSIKDLEELIESAIFIQNTESKILRDRYKQILPESEQKLDYNFFVFKSLYTDNLKNPDKVIEKYIDKVKQRFGFEKDSQVYFKDFIMHLRQGLNLISEANNQLVEPTLDSMRLN